MTLRPKKVGYEKWRQDFTEWRFSNSPQTQNHSNTQNQKFKEFRDEYLRKHKGMSDFFDVFFSSHKKYHEAVNNSDKRARKKALEDALRYAETSKHFEEKNSDPIAQDLGIDNLIDIIKKALDELNSNNSDSTNQES